MISEMAVEDCTDLMQAGAKLTVEEIVRLNALGVRAKYGPHASSFDALPRCAFLGDLVFRELTIHHEVWLDEASRLFAMGDDLTLFALRAFACVTPAEKLPDWSSAFWMRRALARFMRRSLARYTVRQVVACVRWVYAGADWTTGESATPRELPADDPRAEDTSAAAGLLREGIALRLGISVDNALKLTRRELQMIIQRVYKHDEIRVDEDIKAEAIGDYYRTYEEIKAAHAAEMATHGEQT